MRVAGIVGGTILALMGIVWMLQGVNSQFVPQSFMTGSPIWIVIGAVTFVGGLGVARWSWSRG
jgi:hypothetical protein